MEQPKKTWHSNELWEKEIDFLQSIIAKTPLVETNKWGGIVYTYNGKNVVGLGGFKSYVGLWFFNGVFLKDEYKVLVSGGEKTKAQLQWRFNTLEEIDEKKSTCLPNRSYCNRKRRKSLQTRKITFSRFRFFSKFFNY